MTKGFGARPGDAGVAVAIRPQRALAPGLDAGELQLLAEDLGELLDRDVDLEQVLAGGVAGPVAAGFLVPRRDGRARLPLALAHPAPVVPSEPERRDAQAPEGY